MSVCRKLAFAAWFFVGMVAIAHPAHAAWHAKLVRGDLDLAQDDPARPKNDCPPFSGDCNNRVPGYGLSVGVSGHYPLVRFLKLSISPFIEGVAVGAPSLTQAKLRGGVFAGFEIWHWLLGNRLMLGPQMGAAWVMGGLKAHGGLGLAWCLSCSVPSQAGPFRKSLDRVVFKRTGTFNPTRKEGEPFDGSLERWELGFVFKSPN